MPRQKRGAPRRLTEQERQQQEWRLGERQEEEASDDDERPSTSAQNLPDVVDWRYDCIFMQFLCVVI